MKTPAWVTGLWALCLLGCGEPVRLGDDVLPSESPHEVQLASPPELALVAQSAQEAAVIRVPLSCASEEAAACPGYEARLWVDTAGVWLANMAEDRKTVQLAQLAPDGKIVRSARWIEPDPLRHVKKLALWRAQGGELQLALVQEGCDLERVGGSAHCVASGERVRVLSVSTTLAVTIQHTFPLGPGFVSTLIASSAAGAALFADIEYRKPVAGARYQIAIHRLASDGKRAQTRQLRGDFSFPYQGRAGGIDELGQIAFMLNRAFNRVFGLNAEGAPAVDVTFSPERLLDSVLPSSDGRLVLVFHGLLGFELVDLDGDAYHNKRVTLSGLPVREGAGLYFRHGRVGPTDSVELLFQYSPPEGALFCRLARRELDGTCFDLGSPGELWDMHTSPEATWIAAGSSLLGIPR